MAYGVSDILELSEKYQFTYSITEFFIDHYGFKEAEKLLKSLKKPVKNYAVRVNTLKINREEIVDLLNERGITTKSDKIFNDILYIPVEGPFEIPYSDKIIVADKFRG